MLDDAVFVHATSCPLAQPLGSPFVTMGRMIARLVMTASVAALVLGAGACSGGEDIDCTANLLMRQIDGVAVALQDQGAPGRDGCDLGGESVERHVG